MLRIVLLAALAVLSIPAPAHESTGTTAPRSVLPAAARGAAATVDAFHAALKRGDTIAAAALLADDALIFEAGGVERTKAEYAARHLPADAEFAQATSSMVTHRNARSDGTLAWIASEGRTTGKLRGKAINSVS